MVFSWLGLISSLNSLTLTVTYNKPYAAADAYGVITNT